MAHTPILYGAEIDEHVLRTPPTDHKLAISQNVTTSDRRCASQDFPGNFEERRRTSWLESVSHLNYTSVDLLRRHRKNPLASSAPSDHHFNPGTETSLH